MNTRAASDFTRRELLSLGTPLLFATSNPSTPSQRISRRSKPQYDFVLEFDPMWKRTRVYTLEVAAAMPEDRYTYRPVPEVRTFAEQALHIAETNHSFTDIIRGTTLEDRPDFTTVGKSRSEIIALIDNSFDIVIDVLITMRPEELEERVRWTRRTGGESTHSKRGIALTIWHHVTHHRAQLSLYLRLNGIDPPGYMD